MIFFKKRGQSTLEYIVLLIIILGVFAATSNYIKRGLQGRWKAAVDDFGDQYDPRLANSVINYTLTSQSSSLIQVVNAVNTNHRVTQRSDVSSTLETKTGKTSIYAVP